MIYLKTIFIQPSLLRLWQSHLCTNRRNLCEFYGILWGNRKVHVVLLAAINDVDRRLFTDIYEALISLFDQDDIYQEIRNVKTFEEFRSFIYAKIQAVG